MTVTPRAALLEPDARDWQQALTGAGHDMYHVADYVVLDARLYGGTPTAFCYEQDGARLLMPLIVREIPGSGLRDALSPYGYPGPVSNAPDDLDFWARACTAMVETLRGAGIVTAFVRVHPLLPAPLPVLQRFGALVRH